MGVVAAVSRNGSYAFTKPNHEEILLVAGLGVDGDAHAGATIRHRFRMRTDPGQPNLRQVHLIQGELFGEVGERGFTVTPGDLGENVTTLGLDLLGLPTGTVLRFGPEPPPSLLPSPSVGVVADGSALMEPGPSAGDATGDTGASTSGTAVVAAVLAAARTAKLTAAARVAVEALVAAADRGDAVDSRPAVVLTGLRNPCRQIENFQPGLLTQVLGRDPDGEVVRKAGVMAVVLRGGPVRPGDPVTVQTPPEPHRPLAPV